ncbi:Mobile element protein [Desulfosporosinus sp. I2]|uniref:tyrosine-type recombinase/integrase n=1 Tax=Desulfosporosinus sp. I2 TaxID=1617025 RepID=UPI0005EED19B|nr:tyrosine-type recombinase/integrase [Desulfosporosinus sp. I2]KJR44271.1 Mobile element protein [Desulfosporosinus sp. I2]
MEQYDRNIKVVMDFLKAKNYSASVISLHRLCYREFKEYLHQNELSYSFEKSNKWLENNKDTWDYRRYTGWKHCLDQLNDVCQNQFISLDHLGPHASAYALLSSTLRNEIDEFLTYGLMYSKDSRYRISCSRFMLYLEEKGLTSIKQLNYDILLTFHEEDYHRSAKSKDVYEDLIRALLRYHASKGRCAYGHALALNKMLIHQIITIDQTEIFATLDKDGYSVTWQDIETFLIAMKEIGYAGSVLKYTKHILTLLYIFLDMNQLLLNDDILWLWFKAVKPSLKSNWKQARRSLTQYLLYIKSGEIVTNVTGSPYAVSSIEKLPEWIQNPLSDYLGLLKREGWKKSTIAMQKSSNLRFGQYLQHTNINGFDKVTSEVLRAFNQQDVHSTPEGKAAYNCRIRGFIIYLNEQGLISNPFLYKALPAISAPSTRIVRVLSDEEINDIWSVDINQLSPKALRDYAIVCIGLGMGFRASDIASIRFQDINWKQRSISLVQQKTGKAISLPMLVRIGNILFRYLRDARPKSNSAYVFIKHETPYDKLDRGVCRRALIRILPERETSNKGFHVVRKTFATNLLRGNTKVELISDSLGHSTDSTVLKYLSLDEERMRLCPLSLKEIGISWKGGAFNA